MQKDLSLIIASAKRDAVMALVQVRKKYNLPAYLMAGIIDGVSAELYREVSLEITGTAEQYVEALTNDKEDLDVTTQARTDS